MKEEGNVEPSSDPHGHLLGKNILFVKGSIQATADKFKTSRDTIAAVLRTGNEILHEARESRPRPHLDRKIITAWNGLVLAGISKIECSSDAPNREEYLIVAKKQIEFIREYSFDVHLENCCEGDNNGSKGDNIHSLPHLQVLLSCSFL